MTLEPADGDQNIAGIKHMPTSIVPKIYECVRVRTRRM